MVKYAENELFSITTFTKQISSLLKAIKDNSLEVVVLSTEEYSRLKKIEQDSIDNQWSYWRDEELDNFGKIAIGLSRHDYDNEDYTKW
jgi:hypothetical protein